MKLLDLVSSQAPSLAILAACSGLGQYFCQHEPDHGGGGLAVEWSDTLTVDQQ